nr:DNA helicase [Tanacetum cinerariifolium]
MVFENRPDIAMDYDVCINWYQEPALPFEVPTLGVVAYGAVAYGVVAWTERGVPTVTNIAVTNELRVVAYGVVAWTQRGVPTVTNIAVTNELRVVAYGVVAWTQRGVPTVTNIAVTNEDVGSSKGGFFITFTCNVNWPEIKRHMEDFLEITAADRADVVVCVFEQKVHDYCSFLQNSKRFSDVTRLLYKIKFQKRGLPHFHMLLCVKDKIQHAKEVDQYIFAELPNPETDPEGYKVVSKMMVHGLCGRTHTDVVCMKEGTCSKKFPKKYNNEIYFDKDGHVHYQRRETNIYVTRRGAELDNSTDKIFAKVTKPTGQLSPQTEPTNVKVPGSSDIVCSSREHANNHLWGS